MFLLGLVVAAALIVLLTHASIQAQLHPIKLGRYSGKLKVRILISILILLSIWMIGPLKPLQYCIHERKNVYPYQELRNEHFLLVKLRLRARLTAACIVYAGDKYQSSLLIVSGFLLAGFTGTLWWSTLGLLRVSRRQHEEMQRSTEAAKLAAKAAQASADALPVLERAYVFMSMDSDPGFERFFDDIVFRSVPQPLPRRLSLPFSIVNYGKTPAVITKLCATLYHRETMGAPEYRQINLGSDEVVISSGEFLRNPHPSILENYFRVEDPEPIQIGEELENIRQSRCFIWFSGFVRYTDVFGKGHITEWRRQYDWKSKSFLWLGAEHNRRT